MLPSANHPCLFREVVDVSFATADLYLGFSVQDAVLAAK